MPVPVKFDSSVQVQPLDAGVPQKFGDDVKLDSESTPKSSDIYINPDHGQSASRGIYDKVTGAIQDVFKPLSPEERQGAVNGLGKYGGAAFTGVANAALGVSSGVLGSIFHPLSTIKGGAQTAADILNQAFPDAGLNPQQKAAKDASLKRLKEQWEQIKDNPDYAIGNLYGNIEAGRIVGERVSNFKGNGSKALEAASERFRKGMQKVVGGGEKAIKAGVTKEAEAANAARESTLEANKKADEATLEDRGKVDTKNLESAATDRAAQAAHEAAREKVAAENREALRQRDKLSPTQEKLTTASKEAKARIETARAEAMKIGNEKYSGVNGELGGIEADPSFLPDALSNATESLRGSKAEPTILKDISKVIERGDVPTYEDLQGEYSRLGTEISKGNLPGDVYHAYDTLHEAIGDEMQRIADSKGLGAELKDARNYWRRMKQTFGQPLGESDLGNKTLTAGTPEFVKADAQANRLRNLGSFDPEIPKLFEHIENLRKGVESLPKESPLRTTLKAPPEAPTPTPREGYAEPRGTKSTERPELNTRQMRAQFIDDKLASWTSVTRYQLERLVAGPIGLLVSAATGSAIGEVASTAYTIGSMAPFVIQNLMEKPAFREWFTRPPAGELEALQKVPYADRVKITDGLNRAVAQAAMSGKPLKLAPAVAAFMAANTRIVGPKTQSLQDIRDKFQNPPQQ